MTGTIRNDDDQPTVTIADNSGLEGNGNSDGSVEFTVTLSAAAGVPVKSQLCYFRWKCNDSRYG